MTLAEAQISARRGDLEEMEALQMAILASQAETYARANTTYDKAGAKGHLPELGELPYIDETPSFEEVMGM